MQQLKHAVANTSAVPVNPGTTPGVTGTALVFSRRAGGMTHKIYGVAMQGRAVRQARSSRNGRGV